MRPSDRDTIVAIATGHGEAAIGIVRLSGPEAVGIASGFFCGSHELNRVEDRRLTYGRFVVGDQDLDEVMVSVMRGSRSFTGEDTVEFNCHGGPLLLRRAMEALVSAGARQAEPGEFTRRAFLNGRIDLTQAEAIADMITAGADRSLQSAYFQLRGGLRSRFEDLAEAMKDSLTLLEAGLDFYEDADVEQDAIRPSLARAAEEIERLVVSYRQGKVIRDGAVVALAGPPNAGKSSLLNRLLEEDRAIVSPVSGTTRDTIEESITLDGIRVTLVDTAGIAKPRDAIEREGARRSRKAIARAALVLLVVDASVPAAAGLEQMVADVDPANVALVKNKNDLGLHADWRGDHAFQVLTVSALTGEGLDRLRQLVRRRVITESDPDRGVVTHARHAEALRRAGDALCRATGALDEGLPREVVAVDLREAADALAEIVGEITSDEILDRIFSTFCIGK
ncbi:MAG: tRNA uridine-5-carboxymethylaminomethyl(34) synthesis GTPase MnmE [Candidatus Latescibacteria bacterium]|nr:tRNA uridine-5-carboxymethylaminomethyl(34) synthesis GTPase MnmE [Candidatus Latescibacterota bacterium]